MSPFNRRNFLKLIPPSLGTMGASYNAWAAPPGENDQILIYIFLRGGIDGLNVVVPLGNDHDYYATMRPDLAIPESGSGSALPLGSTGFGLNPAAAPLLDLYNDDLLAVINAVGTPDTIASRSHFDAEKYAELGTPGQVSGINGWLHRHFLAMTQTLDLYPDQMLIPIIAFRSTPPTSLLGNSSALTVYSPADFRVDNAFWRWANNADFPDDLMQIELLPALFNPAANSVELAGSQALNAEAIMRESYDPAYTGSGTIPYPISNDYPFPNRMRDLAQLIKLDPDLSLRIATLDLDNWDTHSGQDTGNFFANQLNVLCQSLAAFIDDLAKSGSDYLARTTIILQSEFGRRAYQNFDQGTDHGNGNIMLALGESVNGGAVYGTWPGMYPGSEWVNYANPKNGSFEPELFEGALATTTDFRHILGEFLMQRCQYTPTALANVFPGFSNYSSLGVFKPLNTGPGGNMIMADDFD